MLGVTFPRFYASDFPGEKINPALEEVSCVQHRKTPLQYQTDGVCAAFVICPGIVFHPQWHSFWAWQEWMWTAGEHGWDKEDPCFVISSVTGQQNDSPFLTKVQFPSTVYWQGFVEHFWVPLEN